MRVTGSEAVRIISLFILEKVGAKIAQIVQGVVLMAQGEVIRAHGTGYRVKCSGLMAQGTGRRAQTGGNTAGIATQKLIRKEFEA